MHDDDLTRIDYAKHLANVGAVLSAGPVLEVGENVIEVPDVIEFDLRFERTPHNSLVLLIKAEWTESYEGSKAINTARNLIIRAPQQRDQAS